MGRRDAEPAKPACPERYTLFTNLRWVTIAAPPLRVRCHAHALLLCESPDILGFGRERGSPRREVRAFGVDPAEPVFDAEVPHLDYQLADARGNAIMLREDGTTKPLISGAIMTIPGVLQAELIVEDSDRPIDVRRFEGCITQVWEELGARVARYWSGPNMPQLEWLPAQYVRSRTGHKLNGKG